MTQRTTSIFKSKLRKFISGSASALLFTALFVVTSDQTATAVFTSAPGRVKGLVASVANGSATISWFAPSSSGSSQINRYVASTEDGLHSCSTTGATSCTITGLTNGTPYRFVVTASSPAGTSAAASTTRHETPFTNASAPQTVVTVPGAKSVRVSWTAPNSNGGAAIKSYVVTSSPDNRTCRANSVSTCTVRGLTRGKSYIFSIAAINKAGSSPLAYSLPASPFDVPSAPVTISSQSQGSSINVSWMQPISNGGSSILRYRVTSSPPRYNCTTITTSCAFVSINNGVKYTFNVVATNAVGNSPAGNSAISTPVLTVALPPTNVKAMPDNFRASVSWAAPTSNGGSAITSYTVTSSPGGRTCTTAGTSCVVQGLNNYVFYTFSVTATNSVGKSHNSQDSVQAMPGSKLVNDYLVYPGANLAGVNFTSKDLRNFNLTGANLAGANLAGANFIAANLTGVNLAGANLAGANFIAANLTGANLAGADLTLANVGNARLVGVTLIGANLTGASIRGANLAGTNLSFTSWANTDLSWTNLSATNLTGTNFTGSNLTNVNFQFANLTGTNLTSSNLTGVTSGSIQGTPSSLPTSWVQVNGYLVGPGANLVGADLQGADFSGASLNGTVLNNAQLDGARLSDANLSGVKARDINGIPAELPHEWKFVDGYLFGPGVDLSYANLTGRNLEGVNLEGANLEGVITGSVYGTPLVLSAPWKLINGYLIGPMANLSNANLSGINLDDTNFEGANLSGVVSGGLYGIPSALSEPWKIVNGYLVGPNANLSGANLSGANLIGVYLSGANLSGADLSSANLNNVDLSSANLNQANLTNANLSLANLQEATLGGAILFGANLDQSKLYFLSLDGVDLFFVDLTGVKSVGITGNPVLPNSWTLINGYLIGPGANLEGANLDLVDLSIVDLKGVKSGGITGNPLLPNNWTLINGYLIGPGANLEGANLEGSNLDGVDLYFVDLTGVKSGGITGNPLLPNNWTLINGYLIGPGANLEGAYLDGVDLYFVDLTGVKSGGISGSPALPYNWTLINGYLIGPGANLKGANLAYADLRGANLMFADLSGANLSGALLEGANLFGANLQDVIW